jgi:hypothetical protein
VSIEYTAAVEEALLTPEYTTEVAANEATIDARYVN